MFSVKSIVSRFSDHFKKAKGGFLYKLITIFSGELVQLKQTIDRVDEWRDIDNAQGSTLDKIGENVKQHRGQATDPVYRILIKSKIARNLSDGAIDTIIRVLATALAVEYKDIRLQEKWYDANDPEPAAIKVIELPLAALNATGLDPVNFTRIVKRTVAAGVGVDTIELTGTFEFGDIGDTAGPTSGFGDVFDDSIGGYLGAAYTPSGDIELPI